MSMTLITGGAASGKSEFAERLVRASSCPRRIYLATMQPYGPEAKQRIRKHRDRRAADGYETVECYRDLEQSVFPAADAVVLLDCLGNLAANELFRELERPGAPDRLPDPETAREQALSRMLRGICAWNNACSELLLVTNEVGGGGTRYAGDTDTYLSLLGTLNREAAALSDRVVKVSCGLPEVWKGTL